MNLTDAYRRTMVADLLGLGSKYRQAAHAAYLRKEWTGESICNSLADNYEALAQALKESRVRFESVA